MIKIIILCLGLCTLTSCAGLGFDKRLTLMPDEIWISGDFNPQENFNSDEITGGLKWKLK